MFRRSNSPFFRGRCFELYCHGSPVSFSELMAHSQLYFGHWRSRSFLWISGRSPRTAKCCPFRRSPCTDWPHHCRHGPRIHSGMWWYGSDRMWSCDHGIDSSGRHCFDRSSQEARDVLGDLYGVLIPIHTLCDVQPTHSHSLDLEMDHLVMLDL